MVELTPTCNDCDGCGSDSDMEIHVIGGSLHLCNRCMDIVVKSAPKR